MVPGYTRWREHVAHITWPHDQNVHCVIDSIVWGQDIFFGTSNLTTGSEWLLWDTQHDVGVRLFTVGQTKPGSWCFLQVTHVVRVRLLIAGHSTCVRVRMFIAGHKMTSGSWCLLLETRRWCFLLDTQHTSWSWYLLLETTRRCLLLGTKHVPELRCLLWVAQ